MENVNLNLIKQLLEFKSKQNFNYLNNNFNNSNLNVSFYKKGYKIHIKKKNRGKFTDYCGGKVTSECINKAKHSGSKTLRKRAIFAQNARRWKHLFGGVLNS